MLSVVNNEHAHEVLYLTCIWFTFELINFISNGDANPIFEPPIEFLCIFQSSKFIDFFVGIIFELPVVSLDALSNTEMPSLFTAFTFAPFSMRISTIFSNPVNMQKKRINIISTGNLHSTFKSRERYGKLSRLDLA